MKLTPHTRFLLAVSLQVLILVGLFVSKSFTSLTGVDVLLKIEPVDPRDPLRGDYVTFQYEISRLPKFHFVSTPARGDLVYVPLKRISDQWLVSGIIVRELPKANSDIYLKGHVIYTEALDNTVRMEYGLEQYFIPEGTGRDFNFSNREAFAKVAIDRFGNGVIKELIVDGKKWP